MRINIPWGGIFLIGGLLLVYATDVPSFIGWVAVAFGIFTMIVTAIALVFVAVGMEAVKKHGLAPSELNDKTYRTSHGRRLPVNKKQVVQLRSVESDGNVTVDSKQS